MIPTRLTVRNFMCYRDEQTLDLEGVHLACLSGENGAGKTALLEAITWALWGRARDSERFNDDLISKGATDMEVDLELKLNDDHYRVVRKRSKKGNGSTILDLQVCSAPVGGSWRSLSGGTTRETQALIDGIIKLSYETFINSAFLLQGRADEFTVKTASDRKAVLTNILGMEQYDILEELAKVEARDLKVAITEIENRIKQCEDELRHRAEYEGQLEEIEGSLTEKQTALSTLRTELAGLVSRQQSLEHSRRRVEELQGRIGRREGVVAAAMLRLGRNREEMVRIENLLSRRTEIETGYRELAEARKEEAALNEKMSTLRALDGKLAMYQGQVAQEQAKLTANYENHEREIARLKRDLAGRRLVESQLSEVLERLRRLEELAAQHEDTRCLRETLDVRMRTVTNEKNACEEEGKTLRQKLNMVLTAHAEHQSKVECPLCGTGLSADAIARVQRSYEEDIAAKRQEYDQKRKEIETINAEILQIEKKLEKEREALKPMTEQRRDQARHEQSLKLMDKQEQDLGTHEASVLLIKARLDKGDFAPEARQMVIKIESEIASVRYDERAHTLVKERIAELQAGGFEADYHALTGAVNRQPSVQHEIESDTHAVELNSQEQDADRTEVNSLLPEIGELQNVQQYIGEKNLEEQTLAHLVSSLSEQRGGLRTTLARCDALEEEKARRLDEKKKTEEEKAIYDQLTAAFGKKGVQAMIIENAIPEIENEANTLLSRMTDGRMSVQFATQRDAKSGKNVLETLDINISDEIGTRAYELYSGGEAFRVNFAIRVALSKLLARRAGTQLQTLVIDEGFGSQDGQGREKLVSAIRSIEGDFQKILVITHIDELKEEFPVRINIVKTPNGSRIMANAS